MITLYGIPNCDTVKKARTWLVEHGVDYQFHDFKKQGVSAAQLQAWAAAVGWETLLNRKGTTWRILDPAIQASVKDASSAITVMQTHTSTIKRPVVEWAQQPVAKDVTVGFDAASWAQRL